jgi:predicted nucleotidyltransferase
VKFGGDAEFGAQVRLGDALKSYFRRKVDVVSDRGLSPYIGKYIKKEAVAI